MDEKWNEFQPGNYSRDEKGKWLAGYSGNPNPSNNGSGKTKSWQPYRKRLEKFLDMTIEELTQLAQDKKQLAQLSVIDGAACRQAIGMIFGVATIQERESALNRMEGAPG